MVTPGESGGVGLDLDFDTYDVWNGNVFAQEPRYSLGSVSSFATSQQPSVSSDMHLTGFQVMDSDKHTLRPQDSPENNLKLDERFKVILECINSIGFDNFDALVSAYYSEQFSESSPLSHEQRISRKRRLPKVVAEVLQAAANWSDREREGLQEEVLKQTESVLVAEGNKARDLLVTSFGPLNHAQNGSDTTSTVQVLLDAKKTIESEVRTCSTRYSQLIRRTDLKQLPNLWGLLMALAGENRVMWKRDRSNTALAAVLLLQCSGRLPNDQLHRMLGTCLLGSGAEEGYNADISKF